MNQPVIRLKPKMDPRRIRHGFPWVYANEVVTDRRTRQIPAGSICELQDADRTPLATVAINPASKIIGRVLDTAPSAVIDAGWIAHKVRLAHNLRSKIYSDPFYRLIHAEADGLPGVIADRFGDIVVMQPNAAWADQRVDEFADAFRAIDGVNHLIINGSGRARTLEGLEDRRDVVFGEMPENPVAVPMNGATYFADIRDGQKTGLFFDQRPNHAFVQSLVDGGTVLDVFSHVGGFGLAARVANAASVICVDGSEPALKLAEKGAAETVGAGTFETLRSDAFKALENFIEAGRRFDVVVCDPPAFAPAKPALEAGLRAYERVARLASQLVSEDGFLALCSCSHAATPEKFRAACVRGIGKSGRQAQLIHTGEAGPDHPKHVMLAESGYLKSLFFRVT